MSQFADRAASRLALEVTIMSVPLRILVIDDDPVMRELLEALLGYAGHHVEAVDSGIAALARLEAETGAKDEGTEAHYDVVLTDLHMPVLQGKELARRLLASRGPETVLVGMSGSSPTVEETHLLDEFLQKPFTPDQFEQALHRARTAARPASVEQPAEASAASDPTLDEAIFARLRNMLPAEQLRGLYILTLEDVHARVERMKAHVSEGDLEAAHSEAHAIKGSAGMVGARELHLVAAAAELATCIDFENFALACHRLRRMLDERLSTSGPVSKI